MKSCAALRMMLFCSVTLAETVWVPRPDPMHNHWLMVSDRQGDAARVLYKTMPSLEQSAADNRTIR